MEVTSDNDNNEDQEEGFSENIDDSRYLKEDREDNHHVHKSVEDQIENDEKDPGDNVSGNEIEQSLIEDDAKIDRGNFAVVQGISGKDVSIVGVEDRSIHHYYEISEVSETFDWIQIPQNEIEKISDVYVEGIEYRPIPETDSRRIIIVYGKPHSGRYYLALSQAVRFKSQNRITNIFKLRSFSDSSIFSLLMREDIPKDSIFILQNAFQQHGISLMEINDTTGEIQYLLEQHNLYLFFTHETQIDIQPEINQIPTSNYSKSNLKDILFNHLNPNIYNISKDVIDSLRTKESFLTSLAETLCSPHNIDIFCVELSAEKVSIDDDFEENIERIAASVKRPVLDTRKWFESLPDITSKYFAMEVALFPELSVESFSENFKQDLIVLERGWNNASTWHEYGFQYFLDQTKCRRSDWNTIEFIDQSLLFAVLDEIRLNYFYHFRPLANRYSEIVEKHTGKGGIETRLSYAKAIGEISRSNKDLLNKIIEKWSKSRFPSVRAATGYALQQLCTIPSHKSDVSKLLETLSMDSNFGGRWTAIAAGERVYTEVPDTVKSVIERLRFENELSSTILHALTTISRIDPPNAVSIISGWFDELENEESPVVEKLAVGAAVRLLRDLRPGSVIRRKAFTPLIQKLLQYSPNTCISGLEILAEWLRKDPGNKENVEEVLKNNLDISSIASLGRLGETFENWSNDNSVDVRLLGQKMMAYLNYPNEIKKVENNKQGLIILDISEINKKYRSISRSYAEKLTRMFSMIASPKTYWLGCSRPIGYFTDFDTEIISTTESDYQPARLIGPILEQFEIKEIAFAIVIQFGPIVDLYDWQNTKWVKKLALNQMVDSIERTPGFLYFLRASEEELGEIVHKLLVYNNS